MNGSVGPTVLSINGSLAAQMGLSCAFASTKTSASAVRAWQSVRDGLAALHGHEIDVSLEFPTGAGQESIANLKARGLDLTRPYMDMAVVSMLRSPMTKTWPSRHGFNGPIEIEDKVGECLRFGVISKDPAEELGSLSRSYVELIKKSSEVSLGMVIWSLDQQRKSKPSARIPEGLRLFFFANDISPESPDEQSIANAIAAGLDNMFFGAVDVEAKSRWPGPGTIALAEELGFIESAERYLKIYFKDEPERMKTLMPGVPIGNVPKAIRRAAKTDPVLAAWLARRR